MVRFLKGLLLLPLLPLKPFIFFFTARARTTRVLARVLYVFAIVGALFSLAPGLGLLGLFSNAGSQGARRAIDIESWTFGAALLGAMAPFCFLSVLQWAAAYRVLRKKAVVPLSALEAMPLLDPLVRVFFASLGLLLFLGCVNVSLVALLAVSAMGAIVASILYLIFVLVLILCTVGFVFAGGRLGVGATLARIWHIATLPRLFFELEGQVLSALHLNGWTQLWAASVYLFVVPAVFAIWIYLKRRSIPDLAVPTAPDATC
jgi:hypothetical protein